MSTVKALNHQIGSDVTATNNFVISTPTTPDGTMKLARGNSGATTQDIMSVASTGFVTIPKLDNPFVSTSLQALPLGSYTNFVPNLTYPTASRFTVSGSRATPLQTGWYFISVKQLVMSQNNVYQHVRLNGNTLKHGYFAGSGSATGAPVDMDITTIAYFNGTTDYLDIMYAGTIQQTWGDGPHGSLAMFYICG